MWSGVPSRVWIAIGSSVAVSGLIVILLSLPDGGSQLWIGVGLIAAGSLALRTGLGQPIAAAGAAAATGQRRELPDLERELRAPPPRRVALTPRGIIVLCVWMAVLSGFGLLSHQHFGYLQPPRTKARLDSEGMQASAVIHSLEERSIGDGRTMHFVGYSFTSRSGATTRVNRSVTPRVFARLSKGQATRVVYSPINPEIHYLPDLTSAVSTQMVLFTAVLLLAAAGFAEAQRRLHRRLAVGGVPAVGFTAAVRRRGGIRTYLVNYDAAGKRQTLKARERNPSVRNGQSVTVLYDAAIPTRAVVYRLGMYRARG